MTTNSNRSLHIMLRSWHPKLFNMAQHPKHSSNKERPKDTFVYTFSPVAYENRKTKATENKSAAVLQPLQFEWLTKGNWRELLTVLLQHHLISHSNTHEQSQHGEEGSTHSRHFIFDITYFLMQTTVGGMASRISCRQQQSLDNTTTLVTFYSNKLL